MRIFTERDSRSPFHGEHTIYDSTEEFEEKNPGMQWKKWGYTDPEKLQVGEWIRADDGYVLQLLRIRLFPPREKSKETYFMRLPMGTFAIWRTNDGWHWRQLYAQFSVPHKNSASQRSRVYHGGHIEKIKFATLLVSGVNLKLAVRMTYPMLHKMTNNQYLIKAAKLMDDKIVRKEIKALTEKFQEDLVDKFGDVRLVKELDDLVTFSKKGTDAHRNNILFIMELRNMYKKSRKGKDEPEEAEVTDVPPSEADG